MWLSYERDSWNQPGRIEYALARIAYLLDSLPQRIFGGEITKTEKDYLVRFESPRPITKPTYPNLPRGFPRPATKEDIAKMSRAVILHSAGIHGSS